MKYEYRGRNIEINDILKKNSEKKLSRLEKFFTADTTVYITYRLENKQAVAEVTIPMQGAAPIRGEAAAEDKFVALEAAVDRLERQLIRYRKKLINKSKIDAHLKTAYFAEPAPAAVEEADDDVMQVRRIKRLNVKPMDVSEACLQMELLGHDFFVFRNKESDEINVVYKRKEGGTYGLIEVEG